MRSRIRRPGEGSGPGSSNLNRQRRISRREQELRQRRLLYIATGIAGAVVVLALLIGASYQYWFYPRQELASVNGDKIERRDYWKVRDVQLRQNIAQLSQQLSFASQDQQTQLQQRITLAQEELQDVEGAPIASDTLSSMVDDIVVLDSLDTLGISVTDADVDTYINEQFAPVPLGSPTATPPAEPTAAAWATGTFEAQNAEATQTAEAAAQTATAALGTPEPDASPAEDDEDATPDGSPTVSSTETAEATETVDGSPTTAGSPTVDGSPPAEGSPTVGPTETPTPNAEQALATSESTFDIYERNFLKPADMSMSDYERLIVRPTVARQKVRDQLVAGVPTRADQVRAAHILVATKEAADAVMGRLTAGEDFATVASEVSTDTNTAGNGGDLGWFPRGLIEGFTPVEDAAFALEPEQVSQPVQSDFGWHIVKVYEKEANRPITLSSLQALQGTVFEDWLASRRDEADIDADIELPELDPAAEEAAAAGFQPPPDAPPAPTPTLEPTPELVPPVEGSPELDPGASPTP